MPGLDSQTAAQVNQFKESYGIDLVSLTRVVETNSGQGCPVVAALEGKPESAQAQAFALMGKINAEDRKTDPSLFELKPFDYNFGSVNPGGAQRAWNWVESQMGAPSVSVPVHNFGLNFQMRGTALVFESWNAKTGAQRISQCTNRLDLE